MPQPIAYLSFNGNCADAMRFYEQALDGKLETIVRMADMPCPAEMPSEHGQLIAHARLALDGNGILFAGDCPPFMTYEGIKGVSLTLSYDTVEQAQRVFGALSEGGTVTMPFQPAFWAKSSGMLVDRFGAPWIVNGELIPV
ncbi:MAG: PhnB protein [Burkholderiales bacterium]|jgi:PhnB protein